MKVKSSLLVFILSLLLAVTALGGCKTASQGDPNTNKDPGANQPRPATVEVTLFFSDDQAEYLVPEKRNLTVKEGASDELLAGNIVKELIAGPKNKDLQPTIPAESKLLSLKISEGIASVNFSDEIKSKHPGGSAGETMTMYSLINSLTEINSIDKVQLLIEGKKVETLAGHLDTSGPLERNEDIIKK
ncbi:GerMN domain-containing protein [Syntrophomonas curvata]